MIAGGVITAIMGTAFVSDHIPVRNLALADTHKVVSLTVDGRTRILATDVNAVGDILDRANVKLGAHDLVEPSSPTVLPNGFFNVNVYRAEAYRVVDGDKSTVAFSAHRTPRLIASDAGINLYPEDDVSIAQVQDFVSDPAVGQQVTVERATPVMLYADDQAGIVRSHVTTVAKLLAEKNVQLGAKDVVKPALDSPVVPGLTIKITRIADVDQTVTENLPFSTKTIPDANQLKGTSTVQTAGVNGHRQVSYRVHYENGIEKSRVVLSITGQQDPINQVLVVGTKVTFSGSIEYWRPYVLESAARWGVDPNLMLAIMTCESHGNANASNGSHFGLYQYSAATWQSYGHSMNTIYDGPTQIEATAGRMAQPNGTTPWLASKSCWSKYQ